MLRQDLINDLRKHTGGASFITQKDLAAYLGCDRHTVARLMRDTSGINGKRFYLPDVATTIMHSMEKKGK